MSSSNNDPENAETKNEASHILIQNDDEEQKNKKDPDLVNVEQVDESWSHKSQK